MITTRSRPIPVGQFLDTFDEDSVAKAISYRKAKFDEGVNKVQASINQIADLPTLTQQDSEYLANKINSLTDNLNKTAGLDLSDSRNVNQLSNSALEIANDKTVLNAVSSARNHQKNLKFIEDAKSNPKKYGDIVSVQNEWDYANQLENYRKKRELGEDAVFSYQYKPYKDVEGILSKELEKLKANSKSTISGNYIIDGAEVTSDRLRDIVYSRLKSDPTLSDQIRINSRYGTQGIPDTELLKAKNIAQRLELEQRRKIAGSEMTRLNSTDFKNPKEAQIQLQKAKESFDRYDKAYNTLLTNPNKILLDLETGETTDVANREQLSYELYANNLLKDLVNKHATYQQKIRINPIPMQEANLNWRMQMDKLEYEQQLREFSYKKESEALDRQYKMFEIQASTGKKAKLNADGTLELTEPSRDVPSSTIDDNPKQTFEVALDNEKLQARDMLKDVIKEKLNKLATVMPQNWLDRYVNNMMREHGVVSLDENKSTAKLKQQIIQAGNKNIPSDIAIKEAVKWINQLSRDSKRVWEGEGFISPENAQILSQYTDAVQKINVLSNMNGIALDEALTKAGLTRDAYNRIKDKSNKLNKTAISTVPGASYQINSQGNPVYNNLNPKEQEALNKVNQYVSDYYKTRTQNVKLYSVQNFDPKAKDYYALKNDVERYIKDKGLSEQGVGVNSVFGKDSKWAEMLPDSEPEVKDYNPKTELATIELSYKDADGKTQTLRNQKFRIPRVYMDKYLDESVKKGAKDLTYTDILRLTNNGNISLRSSDGKYKDSWRQTPTKIPLQWKAVLDNPNNVSDNTSTIYVKVPINGLNTPIELKLKSSNPDEAGKQLTDIMSTYIAEGEKLIKQGKLTEEQLKLSILNKFLNQ